MISKRDSKPILIKFPIGVSKTNKLVTNYQDDWMIISGLISEPRGSISFKEYGNELDFDKVITVNAGSISRSISYDTIFMIDDMPTINYPKGDYYPKYIYPEYNGEIVIGLKRFEGIDLPKLYFISNNNVLYFQINYDNETKKGYINSKQIIPISDGSQMWLTRPVSNDTSSNRLTLSSRQKIGFDNHFKNFYELTFIEDTDV